MSRIFICGDTHATIDIDKLLPNNFTTGQELTKQDYVIIAGDFGFIWKSKLSSDEQHWKQWFDNQPWTTLIVPGNHENYDRIFELPKIESFNGTVRKYSNSILLLERGETYIIGNNTFWVMGGALSIDKDRRILAVSYWPQEIPSYSEMNHGIDTLHKLHGKVDYIITHASPVSWIHKVLYNHGMFSSTNHKYQDPTAEYLNEILDNHLVYYKN
jgi:hypothetical protein